MNKLRVKGLRNLGVVLLFLVFAVGCASIPKTPQGRYAASLRAFNDAAEMYADYYAAATPKTQEKWKGEIDPLILKASEALDLWSTALGAGEATAGNAAAYEQLWRELSAALIKFGIVEVTDD